MSTPKISQEEKKTEVEPEFILIQCEEVPRRTYEKKSKYDPIIDRFLDQKASIVKVQSNTAEANYLRTQLKKRIDSRGLKDTVDVAVVNDTLYLEKLTAGSSKSGSTK